MTNKSKPNSHDSHGSTHSAHDQVDAPEQKPISGITALVGAALVLLVFAVLWGFGLLTRHNADKVLAQRTNDLAAPSVIALNPERGQPVDSFVLPGNVTAFTDSPIYARTSGYLTKWYFDIGAKVPKGALLAEIATPELDQQLSQAQSDLATFRPTATPAW